MRPEDLATPEAFRRRPRQVWQWYAARWRAAAAARPNPGHLALARWEELYPSFTLVTQNVDGLHQRAGSRSLIELHGTLSWARCDFCGSRREMGEAVAASSEAPPVCSCGGPMRPAVVWFGEALPHAAMEEATEATSLCEVFLSVGTSGAVYPAAGLIVLARRMGACLVEVNPERTPFTGMADLHLEAPAGEALPALTEEIERWRRPSAR